MNALSLQALQIPVIMFMTAFNMSGETIRDGIR